MSTSLLSIFFNNFQPLAGICLSSQALTQLSCWSLSENRADLPVIRLLRSAEIHKVISTIFRKTHEHPTRIYTASLLEHRANQITALLLINSTTFTVSKCPLLH